MNYPSNTLESFDINDSEKIDRDVVLFVFETENLIASSWTLPFPSFSTDRQLAMNVITRMRGKPPDIYNKFNELLKKWHNKCSANPFYIASRLVMLTPDVICILAITACLECDN